MRIARITLSSLSRRMPLSTPDVAEIVATMTDSTMRPICAALPWGMPKSVLSP